MNEVEKLAQAIENSHNIVFFGGAGVSTESDIPDFRSVDGLYNQKYNYPPETILSHTFFMRYTEEFYKFYKDKMIFKGAKPNFAHLYLAKLEQSGKLKGIITQNIDNLHYKAGSKKVMELHGSVERNYCMECGKFYNLDYVAAAEGVPHCDCTGVVKPDVVLYEEGLNEDCISESIKLIEKADLLIVAGTSLNVYPAAGFVDYFNGRTLAVINKERNKLSQTAQIVIDKKIGETFKEVSALISL